MKPLVVIAGYTKISHIKKIRGYFPDEDIVVACAYQRLPTSVVKQSYLRKFDVTYDLSDPSDVIKLRNTTNVLCITCTQERDMPAYIKTLALCGKISSEQALKYSTVIDKHTFKQSIEQIHPDLVPRHTLITDDLLNNLETLTYPQVIKPSGLAGSTMVKVVHSPEEFSAHYHQFSSDMQRIGTQHYCKTIEILTEEYISGPQYSINTYVNESGGVTLCPIIRVITPKELGVGDTYSALQYTTNELSKTKLSNLTKSIQIIIDHFEIKNTTAHFDTVFHDNSWKFFEVGLRIGGHRQELYERSFKMDHLKNDILNRLNKQIIIPARYKVACVVQKASLEIGTLQKISYVRSIAAENAPLIQEDKIRKIGKHVAPVSEGGATLTRYFVVGPDEKSVIATSQELFHSITFDVKSN